MWEHMWFVLQRITYFLLYFLSIAQRLYLQWWNLTSSLNLVILLLFFQMYLKKASFIRGKCLSVSLHGGTAVTQLSALQACCLVTFPSTSCSCVLDIKEKPGLLPPIFMSLLWGREGWGGGKESEHVVDAHKGVILSISCFFFLLVCACVCATGSERK